MGFRDNMPCSMKSSFATLALLASLAGASYDMIATYQPASDVSQHARIDLDQVDFETRLAAFTYTGLAYTEGGHSGATVTLTVPGLGVDVAKGAVVKQGTAVGTAKSAAAIGDTSLVVSVSGTSCVQGGAVTQVTTGCFVTGSDVTTGCFVTGGTAITVGVTGTETDIGLATAAKSKMIGQVYYQAYRAYWGVDDYANQFVLAALGGVDVTNYAVAGKSPAYRNEVAKKGSVYWNVWMYVVREMEDAIDDCSQGCVNCNDDPVHAWDEAVAFYTGSLETKLLYALADKRCKNFGTCTNDQDNDKTSGSSAINGLVFEQFTLGQAKLLSGDCISVQAIKDQIVDYMSVPLVQGALRYAYKVDKLSGGDKEKAEMVAFTGAILPRVAACSVTDAATIRSNMFIDGTVSSGFLAVKQAFGNNYACMGITCAQIGGLMLNDGYYDGASPCEDATSSTLTDCDDDEFFKIAFIVAVAVVGLLVVAVAVLCWKMQSRSTEQTTESLPTATSAEPQAAGVVTGNPVQVPVLAKHDV